MGASVETLDLERFGVSPSTGFLPAETPPRRVGSDVPDALEELDELARSLPTLLDRGKLRSSVESLAPPAPHQFDVLSDTTLTRTYTISGFFANAYVNKIGAESTKTIPRGVAVPLYEAADRLGRTPVLSYDAYVLHNWRRLDGTERLRPHDLDSITTFTDLPDERWFIVIHAAIEAAAGPALAAIGEAQRGILDRKTDRVHRALRSIEESLHEIVPILDRMGEHNDPEMYGEGFRPYLGALTGVEFEGVDDLEGTQSFRGASGAQSSIFPALDAAFGIDHGDTPLVEHLHTLRQDMPPAHRAFIEAARTGPSIKAFAERTGEAAVREAYNECIDQMVRFRERHYDVVEQYLASKLGETTGTGGTPYGDFLAMFTETTRSIRLPD